jgi:hypothetical protein
MCTLESDREMGKRKGAAEGRELTDIKGMPSTLNATSIFFILVKKAFGAGELIFIVICGYARTSPFSDTVWEGRRDIVSVRLNACT